MSFPELVKDQIARDDGWEEGHADRLLMRLKELLAAHDRGDLDLRGEAEELRRELYGVDGFDHPKCVMVAVAPDGTEGAFRGPLLMADLLATGEPGPWPESYRLFIREGDRRTHRWHGKRMEWVRLKNHTN